MENNNYSAKYAYTEQIASSYETDRSHEKIWQAEQGYINLIVDSIPEHAYVLDIPVGTGRFLEYYQSKSFRVMGIDISSHMLTEAKSKVSTPCVELALGDAMNLDYPDSAFSHIVCFRLLHLIPPEKLTAVIHELSRVASGKLYFQAYVCDGWFYPLRIKEKFFQYIRMLCKNDKPPQLPWGHIQSFNHTEKSLLALFAECGLMLRSAKVIGVYGALRVKVYALEKTINLG